MLQLTEDSFDCYASPARIGIANDLNVIIPEGTGMIRQRWDDAAQKFMEELRSLTLHGQFLEYHWCEDDTTIEVRIHNDRYPATCALTHPCLIKHLHSSVTALYECEIVIYVHKDRIKARPQKDAIRMESWKGPYDISTGYCMDWKP